MTSNQLVPGVCRSRLALLAAVATAIISDFLDVMCTYNYEDTRRKRTGPDLEYVIKLNQVNITLVTN